MGLGEYIYIYICIVTPLHQLRRGANDDRAYVEVNILCQRTVLYATSLEHCFLRATAPAIPCEVAIVLVTYACLSVCVNTT